MNPLYRAIAVALFVLPLAAPVAEATRTYKWVDDEGVTHYSQYPPTDQDADVIEPRIGLPSSAPDAGDEETAGSDTGDSEDTGPKTMEAYCKQLRDQLKLLNSSEAVRVRNEDGTLAPLEGDARAARRAEVASSISEHCSN